MWPVNCVHASAIGLSLFTTSFNLGRHLPSLEGTASSSVTFYGSQSEAQRPVALQPHAIFSGKSSSSFSFRYASFTTHRRISPDSLSTAFVFKCPGLSTASRFVAPSSSMPFGKRVRPILPRARHSSPNSPRPQQQVFKSRIRLDYRTQSPSFLPFFLPPPSPNKLENTLYLGCIQPS